MLFIAGLGRSGSTLLDRVLGQVPGCRSIGEASQVWKSFATGTRCGCGRLPGECPFWTDVVDRAFGGWDQLDVAKIWALQRSVDRTRFLPLLVSPRRPAVFEHRLRRYAEVLSDLYRGVAAAANASVVVDSGKHTSTAYLLRHVPGLDLRIVHLIRDSRGVAYSWTKTVKKSGLPGAEEMDRLRPGQVARSWLLHNLLLNGLALSRTRTLRLRYEDFVATPRQRLEGLLEFAGLPADQAALPFVTEREVDLRREDHTLAGNPMRFRRDTISLVADEAWRTSLPPRQQRLVGTVTAPLLRAYGYRTLRT